MIIDKQKLQSLAKKARPMEEWYGSGDLRYADEKTGEIHGLHHDEDSFIAAASPAVVLALLDENKQLEYEVRLSLKIYLEGGARSDDAMAKERDQ